MSVSCNPEFQICVVTLSGKTIELGVDLHDYVGYIKEFIRHKEGIHPGLQRLFFEDTEMDDMDKVCHYNIKNKSTLHVVFEKESRPRRTIRV